MATIEFEPGDPFDYKEGHGIVLPDGSAVLVISLGRSGWIVKKDHVPQDASPVEFVHMNAEVKMALRGAWAATQAK